MQIDSFEIYNDAMSINEDVWSIIEKWEYFDKNTVGKQFVRSTDSIASNIAEGYGRYFYKERRQFLYYARGSLLESITWLNIAHKRSLITDTKQTSLLNKLERLHQMINGYIRKISELANK